MHVLYFVFYKFMFFHISNRQGYNKYYSSLKRCWLSFLFGNIVSFNNLTLLYYYLVLHYQELSLKQFSDIFIARVDNWINLSLVNTCILILLCFAQLYFADTVFYNLKGCDSLLSSKTIDTIFLIACSHVMSLCQTLVILTIFQTSLLLYLLWWSMIRDLWYHYCRGTMNHAHIRA